MPTVIINQARSLNHRVPAALLRRPTAFPPGAWAPSEFIAQLSQITANEIVASAFLQEAATNIPILLFCQDAPTIVEAQSQYGVATVTAAGDTLDGLNFPEQVLQDGDVDIAPFTTLITAASLGLTSVGPGQFVTGLTPTSGISVSGFMAGIPLVDRSLVDDMAADLTALVTLRCHTRSGVKYGPMGTYGLQNYEGGGTNDPNTGAAYADRNTVILRVDDYTQAIRDAGNVFTSATGVVTRVVGLHAIPAAP